MGDTMSISRNMLCACVLALSMVPALAAKDECQAWEFESPHRDWSAACVAQWLGNINIPEHIQASFEAAPIEGKDLRSLNETTMGVPASEGGLNVTDEKDRAKIIDGVKRLEQAEPSDSSD